MQALPELATVLKGNFVPYLPAIMESLLKDAQRSVDMKIVTAKESELENADDEEEKSGAKSETKNITLAIRGVEGPLQISMNTAALENKISALQIIKALAVALGPLMGDYVDRLANLYVNDLMHNQTSTTVRKTSTKTLSILLMCARDNE